MPTLRQIQRRIRSIQSTAKTTRAMSLVAGSKMRRAQQLALAHRPYATELQTLLTNVVESISGAIEEDVQATMHPLLERRTNTTPGLLLITPDRGLCGGLNTNLIRAATLFAGAHPNTKLITVGRKGNDFFRRTRAEIIGSFLRMPDYPTYDDALPIARLIMDAYTSGEIDSLAVIYPRFVNTVVQRTEAQELLPVSTPPGAGGPPRAVEYIYEPDPISVLNTLMPRYVEIQVYRAVLELAASEQSARMVAMRNATDAAQEMILQLTLVRNKLRQEQITKELLDITGGVEAMAQAH